MFVNGRNAAAREERCAMNPDLPLSDLTDTDFTINETSATDPRKLIDTLSLVN